MVRLIIQYVVAIFTPEKPLKFWPIGKHRYWVMRDRYPRVTLCTLINADCCEGWRVSNLFEFNRLNYDQQKQVLAKLEELNEQSTNEGDIACK